MQPFDLKLPKSLGDALAQLDAERSYTAPQLIAGGQDVLTVMKDDIVAPTALVDISGLELGGVADDGAGGVVIGATATIQEIADDPVIAERFPVLREAARSVASPQIRSKGTVGGNLNQKPRCPYYRHSAVSCYKRGGTVCLAEFGFNKYAAILGGGPSYFSHPSDMAVALIAADAEVDIAGPDGERSVPLAEYYVLPEESVDSESVLAPNEAVVRLRVPAPPEGARSTYVKFKERASYDFALAAAGVTVVVGDDGKIESARVVLGGVAPKPWHSPEAEAALVGQPMGEEAWIAAGEAAVADAVPLEMNGYKVHLVKGVLRRALESIA